MRQVSQNYKSGAVNLEQVDPPALKRGGVLVRSAYSVISQGTEGMKVREAKMNLVEKARARPDQVKKVMQTVQQQGLTATYHKVMNKLDSLTPLGYSLSGVVEAVGQGAEEFEVGQRVACAGAGYANHAEINFVPRQLVVPVPDSVSMEQAAFATIGAIALHGFRQGDMRLGETACVIGLGLVGQVLCRILSAAGMQVIGIDPSAERCRLAEESGGASRAAHPDDDGVMRALQKQSGGYGADCVFLCASSSSNAPLEQAISLCRDRGRIVCVGKTALDLPYVEMFQKEIDIRFSRSYGPGRYDPTYEEKGIDYPIGYVRWTEQRNLAAFLQLIASGRIDLTPMIDQVFPFDDAVNVYERMHAGEISGLGILFHYAEHIDAGEASRPTMTTVATAVEGAVRLGVIGAGNYASSMLLPHLKDHKQVMMQAVATGTSLSGANAARKFGFVSHGTDYQALLRDDSIDAVLIATRHASHARMTAEALSAGKAVFVEKPLAIDEEGLTQVLDAVHSTGNDRLQVGFNRRFSPIIQQMKKMFQDKNAPLVMHYRVHAGPLDQTAWQCDPAEGTRFIGEAGHFFDVFAYLTGAMPRAVTAMALRPEATSRDDLENMAVTVQYDDGSVATLHYLTQGGTKLPKEWLEVSGGGKTVQMENFERLCIWDARAKRLQKFTADKGQKAQMMSFVQSIKNGEAMPMSLPCLEATTRVTLAADQSMRTRQMVLLS